MHYYQVVMLFGALAAILFLGAAFIAATRVVPPKKRLHLHRIFAIGGLLVVSVHIILALRIYF